MKRILTALAGAAAASLFAVQVAVAEPPGEPHHRPDSLGADWRQQQDEARQGVRQRRLMPLGSVIESLRRRTGGRQLDAGLEYAGDRAIYRVRWMTADGRRVDYMIDATTGSILSGH
jgi:uncharacterized membrane protein YkoI